MLNTQPKSINEFVNCETAKKILEKLKKLDTGNFGHTLIFGPRGTGSTTLARLICEELKLSYMMINAAEINSLTALPSKRFFIIDEVHKLRKLDIFQKATIIGTCHLKKIPLSVKNNFRHQLYLEYSTENIKTIIMNCARNNKIEIEPEIAYKIAVHSNGIPRVALQTLVNMNMWDGNAR